MHASIQISLIFGTLPNPSALGTCSIPFNMKREKSNFVKIWIFPEENHYFSGFEHKRNQQIQKTIEMSLTFLAQSWEQVTCPQLSCFKARNFKQASISCVLYEAKQLQEDAKLKSAPQRGEAEKLASKLFKIHPHFLNWFTDIMFLRK